MDQALAVTLLDHPDVCFPGKMANLSRGEACLRLDRDLQPGTLLKIETGDTLFLGEVIYSQPVASGFHVGVALEHALYHVQSLAALSRRLLDA